MHEVCQAEYQPPVPRRAPRCGLAQVEERRRFISRRGARAARSRRSEQRTTAATAAAAAATGAGTAAATAGRRLDAPATVRGPPVEAVVHVVRRRRPRAEGVAPEPCATAFAWEATWESAGRREPEPRWVDVTRCPCVFPFGSGAPVLKLISTRLLCSWPGVSSLVIFCSRVYPVYISPCNSSSSILKPAQPPLSSTRS